MVALLSPSQLSPVRLSPAQASPGRLAPRSPSAKRAPSAAQRPRHLRLVETKVESIVDPLSVVAVAGVIAMVLLVVLVRGVQGAPPATDWEALTSEASNAAIADAVADLSGQVTMTVGEGDTWASIAAEFAPGVDPVDFARRGAAANGGYQLGVGQVIVVPGLD